MMKYKPLLTNDHLHQNELSPDGVKTFWEKVATLL